MICDSSRPVWSIVLGEKVSKKDRSIDQKESVKEKETEDEERHETVSRTATIFSYRLNRLERED